MDTLREKTEEMWNRAMPRGKSGSIDRLRTKFDFGKGARSLSLDILGLGCVAFFVVVENG